MLNRIGPSNVQTIDNSGQVLAEQNFTADVAISATTSATANTVVTAPATTFDGLTEVDIEYFCPMGQTGSGGNLYAVLYDGSTELAQIGIVTSGSGVARAPMRCVRTLTPSAGSHTYSIRGFRDTADGSMRAGTGSINTFAPGFIRIKRKSSWIGAGGIAGRQGGYAPLSSGLLVPTAYQGSGTASAHTYLRGDQSYAPPPPWSPLQTTAGAVSGTTSGSLTLQTPSATVSKSDSIYFIEATALSLTGCITSISQTNVTWTLLRRYSESSLALEIWKGVPSGTPGTAVNLTLVNTGANTFGLIEVPAEYGMTGTLVTQAETFGNNPWMSSGHVQGNAPNSLNLCVFSNGNGSVTLKGPTGPMNLILTTSHSALSYAWVGRNGSNPHIPFCTSGGWACLNAIVN